MKKPHSLFTVFRTIASWYTFYLVVLGLCFATRASAQLEIKSVPLDCGGWFSGFVGAKDGRIYGWGDVFGAWRSDDHGNKWSYLNWNLQEWALHGQGIAVDVNNSDTVYYLESRSLYKSENGGASWKKVIGHLGSFGSEGIPLERGATRVLLRAGNPNEVWLAAGRSDQKGTLWKSPDGGKTWQKIGGGLFENNQTLTLHNSEKFPDQIWVGTNNGLFASGDGGETFIKVPGNLSHVGMITRFASGTGLVSRGNGGGGISRITAGNFASPSSYFVAESKIAGAAIGIGYPTGLMAFSDGSAAAWNTDASLFVVSKDKGINFSKVATKALATNVPIWTTSTAIVQRGTPDYGTDQMLEDPTIPSRWYITGGLAPMYSEDKGATWQYLPNNNGIAGVKAYRIRPSRFSTSTLYIAASDIGVSIVKDSGDSGQATYNSMRSFLTLHNFHDTMEGPDPQVLVAAGTTQSTNRNAIIKSTNGGSTWTELNLSSSGLPDSPEGITRSIMSLTDSNDFIVLIGDYSASPGMFRTKNGGATFSKVSGLPDNMPVGGRYGPEASFLDRDGVNSNTRYFVCRDAGFFRSKDGGTTWYPATNPFGSSWVWDMAVDSSRAETIWTAGDSSGVKVSRDGGTTWTDSALKFNARFVAAENGKVAVYGTSGEDTIPSLYYSHDDGATWEAITNQTQNFFGITGLSVDRLGRVWISWNSVTRITPPPDGPTSPIFSEQPQDAAAQESTSVSYRVSTWSKPIATYQWQHNVAGSSEWSDLTDDDTISGAKTQQLTIDQISIAMSGDKFRAVATNSIGTKTSLPAQLNVTPLTVPVIESNQAPSGSVGNLFRYVLKRSGFVEHFDLVGGSLPRGIDLNPITGELRGTPSEIGSFSPIFSGTNRTGASISVPIPITIIDHSDSFLYEPFNYTPGTGALANGSGGTGWGASWSSTSSDVAAGNLSSPISGLIPPAGGHAAVSSGTSSFRDLALRCSEGTYWISFISNSGGSGGENYAGISLFDRDAEKLLIGQRWGTTVWGIERTEGGSGASSTISTLSPTLLVVKIVLRPGPDDVFLWINPTLDAEPSESTATSLTGLTTFAFDRIRLQQNLGGARLWNVDELRMGYNYREVTSGAPKISPQITKQPLSQDLLVGDKLTLTVEAVGTYPLSYQWKKDNIPIEGATGPSLIISSVSLVNGGSYVVELSNVQGIITSEEATVVVRSPVKAPTLTSQPLSQTLSGGGSFTLSVSATGTGPLSYQWRKNGVAIPDATAETFTINSIQVSDSGDYTVDVFNSAGKVTSRFSRLVVGEPVPGRLINMSVRSLAGYGGEPLIVGFVMRDGSRNMLVRADGPVLGMSPFNVPGTMDNPMMEVHASVAGIDTVLYSNDNWGDNGVEATLSSLFADVGAFPLPLGSLDAAVLSIVDPAQSTQGAQTVHVSSVSGGSGVVLVEAFDTGSGGSGHLVNVSARNQVGTGSDLLIIGFVISGNVPKRMLVRAVGPGLAVPPFNVPGTLPDPELTLHTIVNGLDTIVAANDDWSSENDAAEAFTRAGAFPLPLASKDSSIVMTLPPGSYTAVCAGVGGKTGNAIVEAYELP